MREQYQASLAAKEERMEKAANEAFQRWVAESQRATRAQTDEIGAARAGIEERNNFIKNLEQRLQQSYTALEGAERKNVQQEEETCSL